MLGERPHRTPRSVRYELLLLSLRSLSSFVSDRTAAYLTMVSPNESEVIV